MICSCCGYDIKDHAHPIEDGKKFVCNKCWNDPSLFFAERLQDDTRLQLLHKMAIELREQPSSIHVKVLKLRQKDIEMYVGKIKAKDILQLYEIDKFKEEELEGYQREQYEERTSDLVDYLVKCPVAVMPGLFISLRKASFTPENADFGDLEIPRERGSVWIIDGQHRMGGFEKVRDRFTYAQDLADINPEAFSSLMNYELPVVFINSLEAAERISNSCKTENTAITSEDLERAIFFIVNKTQKGISPSLKDALLYRIKIGGIEGIPILRKESWRIHASYIGISMSREEDSPLNHMINISGKKGTGKPVQLNSFVSSLQPLFSDKSFSELSDDERLKFVKTFWRVLREMFPEAFGDKTWKEHMLLKAIGVYCLNWLAYDIFRTCVQSGLVCDDGATLRKSMDPLRYFDWKNETSSFSALGGMKGARRGHEMLLGTIQSIMERPEAEARPQRLEDHIAKK